MPEPTLSLPDAERLADDLTETLDELDNDEMSGPWQRTVIAYVRERVASDLAGLRRHVPVLMYRDIDPAGVPFCAACEVDDAWPCPDARRYSDNLRRSGRLYGVPDA